MKERAKEYPVERVAEITWIPAQKIVQAAEFYATTKPAVAHHRVAMDQNINSTQSSRAIIDLIAITGNIDVKGGNLLPPKIEGYIRTGILSGGGITKPSAEIEDRRIGADVFPLVSSSKARFCGGPTLIFVHPGLAMEAMELGKPYPLKALYCSGGNPLVNTMDVRRFRDALLKLDLLVVADYFMTPTAELADYVLPATTWLERDEPCDDGYTDYIAARQKAVEPVGEARDDLSIVIDLVKRIPWADRERVPWDDPQECYEWMVRGMGMSFAQFKQRGYIQQTPVYQKYEKSGFDTPSGKVELRASRLEEFGYDPLPGFREPPESPTSTPDLYEKYPLVLITGARQIEYMTSEGRQVPALRDRSAGPGAGHPSRYRREVGFVGWRLGMAGNRQSAWTEDNSEGKSHRSGGRQGRECRVRLVVPGKTGAGAWLLRLERKRGAGHGRAEGADLWFGASPGHSLPRLQVAARRTAGFRGAARATCAALVLADRP